MTRHSRAAATSVTIARATLERCSVTLAALEAERTVVTATEMHGQARLAEPDIRDGRLHVGIDRAVRSKWIDAHVVLAAAHRTAVLAATTADKARRLTALFELAAW
jgi:hypothetical protein